MPLGALTNSIARALARRRACAITQVPQRAALGGPLQLRTLANLRCASATALTMLARSQVTLRVGRAPEFAARSACAAAPAPAAANRCC